MKINCFSVTFWFNIFEKHTEILNIFSSKLKDEFTNFNVFNNSENLLAPIIMAKSATQKTTLTFSKINLQYTIEDTDFANFTNFKERALELFEIITENDIEVLHSATYINAEITDDNALNLITKEAVSKNIKHEDLVDVNLKLGKKYEDIFYKIITISNKKQIQLPQKVDSQNRLIPIPLISWHGAYVEKEIIEISYEINDKYSFDFTKNYHTTEFYLNKMLYVLENDFESDYKSLVEDGEF